MKHPNFDLSSLIDSYHCYRTEFGSYGGVTHELVLPNQFSAEPSMKIPALKYMHTEGACFAPLSVFFCHMQCQCPLSFESFSAFKAPVTICIYHCFLFRTWKFNSIWNLILLTSSETEKLHFGIKMKIVKLSIEFLVISKTTRHNYIIRTAVCPWIYTYVKKV